MERNEISINMPDVSTFKYKAHIKEIEEMVRELNGFTLNLESKVNMMLKGQETEFVNSYKQHMYKIETTLKEYQARIEGYQKKIQHYEHEGMLSILLKKIQLLEENEKRLLNMLEKKDRTVLALKSQMGTQQHQILSLEAKIKELILGAPQYSTLIPSTFPTEINSIDKLTFKSNNSIQYLRKPSPQYQTITNSEQSQRTFVPQLELKKINQQVQALKKRNRDLSSVNSKIIEKANSIQQFFVRVVNDLKKKISGRKRFFSQCSFQDFKQEDKLQLLVKVLSNEDVLQHLYNKIFNRVGSLDLEEVSWEGRGVVSARGKAQQERVISRLPAISSLRR